MITLDNRRRHSFVCEGVHIPPGLSEHADDAFARVGSNDQFKVWVRLGWVAIAPAGLVQRQAEAQHAADEAQKRAAEAKAAAEHAGVNAQQARDQAQRDQASAELDAELRAAQQRIAASKGGA